MVCDEHHGRGVKSMLVSVQKEFCVGKKGPKMEQGDFDFLSPKVFDTIKGTGWNLAKYQQPLKRYREVLTLVADHLSLGQEQLR